MNIKIEAPLVCICIPTYNAEKTVRDTLGSILSQSYENLRIHVVDNASTDHTLNIVAEFDDHRIMIHRNEVNLGGEGNFNRCLVLARGKYTAIYHADDIYDPTMIATQVAFLEQHPEAGAVFTQALVIDEDARVIGAMHKPKNLASHGAVHYFPEVFKAILEHSNFLICPSAMALTSVYQNEVKCWRGELFGSSADLDVWLRILLRGPVGVLPQATMRYRISQSQGSANVRLDIGRAAFFSVVDYYLAQPEVRSLLTVDDLMNYQRLENRDRVMRAVNALLQDQPGRAAILCPEVFSRCTMKAAWQTRRGMIVLALALYLKVMLALRWHRVAKATLIHLKRMANK